MMEAKSIPVRSVAMPVMGTGTQRLRADLIIQLLLRLGRDFAERLPKLWWGAVLIVLLWLALLGAFVWWLVATVVRGS